MKTKESAEREEKAIELIHRIQTGDSEAVDELKQLYKRSVTSIAEQYVANGMELDVLIGKGFKALVKAAKNYDDKNGYSFTDFCIPCIRLTIISLFLKGPELEKFKSAILGNNGRN